MKVFDVFVNDRKVCRAGVGEDGVLDTMVTWVKLTGAAAREARRLNAPIEETKLHVGGLSKDTHLRWVEHPLAIGDRVTIAIATARRADAPGHRKKRNRKEDEERERQHYLRLKYKYEPSLVERARDNAGHGTRFLNVDLDIWSHTPLDELVAALGRRVVVLYVGKEARQFAAHLELANARANADQTITRFAALVEDLPRSVRKLWKSARIRQLNVGVQAETAPHAYELRLRPSTVASAARIGAHLAFTVYAPL